jgi:hypothetical protein
MREKQKQMREEKASLKADKAIPANLDEIFEKKYNSQFDFMKEKLLALTQDIGDIKREKLEKKERKQKEEDIRKQTVKVAPAPTQKSEAVVEEPPTPFKAPKNDTFSFRNTFKRGGYNF